MPLTNATRDAAAGLIRTNASHLAIGSGTTAFAASQTALTTQSGDRKAVTPAGSGNEVTASATWGTGEANVAWQEWGLFSAVTGGTMYNRRVESLGTKTSSQSWTLSVTLTVTVA